MLEELVKYPSYYKHHFLRLHFIASQVRSMNQQQQQSNGYDYTPASQTIYAAPPPAYMSAPDYGWVPVERFPDRPPENTVYMHDAPPPYSGIYPPNPPKSNTSQVTNGFYNPSDPTKVYAPSSAPQAEVLKKIFLLNFF
jgi:hypothetical protein